EGKMKVVRVYAYAPEGTEPRLVPAGVGRVPAGFPSPAQDYADTQMDLTVMLIRYELATVNVRVSCESMVGAGLFDEDDLIVAVCIERQDGDIVVAVLDNEMTVKRLHVPSTGVILQAENADYPDVSVSELSDLLIWGVVTTCLHHLLHR